MGSWQEMGRAAEARTVQSVNALLPVVVQDVQLLIESEGELQGHLLLQFHQG